MAGFIESVIGSHSLIIPDIILPIGISFYTFQQIAYIVNVYNGEISQINLLDYVTYILYFPKVMMGPLMEPVDFLGQINNEADKKPSLENIVIGIKLFSFGLLKKVLLADTFSKGVLWVQGNPEIATSMDLILCMLFYTFEIYFDFSGYSDMATGVSIMLNIRLPINFDSPYKALSIRDFWKRWHISLTSFLTKYIYIPLGGSRKGKWRTCINVMLVFLISGIWHGANWTFILWGILHGLFSVLERLCEKFLETVFEPVRWFVTFISVNVLWLLFCAPSVKEWLLMLKGIVRLQDLSISEGLINEFIVPEGKVLLDLLHLNTLNQNIRGFYMVAFLIATFTICLIPNNNYKTQKCISIPNLALAVIAFIWGLLCIGTNTNFIYMGF